MSRGRATAVHETLRGLGAYLAPAASLQSCAEQRICQSARHAAQCYRGEGNGPVGQRRPGSDEQRLLAAAAIVPISVTPPEVPGGTFLPDVIEIGSPPNSVPISVAQVSAVDAANAPIPARVPERRREHEIAECRKRVHPSVGEHLPGVPLAPLLV